MGKLTHSTKLARELWAFAKANKAWWILPLMILLSLAAVLVVAGQGTAPFIYTLF
ncbi:MAG: hypothetical protein FJ100_12755 [Deltaproteobacteria bacterium]|nr:hypothetical protein [Deltaproteobacteria bacterium]